MNLWLSLLLLCGTAGAAAAADSQDPEPPLFGQRPETMKPVSVLDGAVLGGFGRSLAGDGVNEDASVTGKYYTGLRAGFAHERRKPGRTLTAAMGTSIWYFPAHQRLQTIDRSARVGLDAYVKKSSRVQLSQSFLQTPFRRFGAIPTETSMPTVNPDSAGAVGKPSYDLGTAALVEHYLTRKMTLELGYSSRWHYADPSDQLLTQRLSGGVRVEVAQGAALVLGAARQFGRSGPGSRSTTSQDFVLGLDLDRPLFSAGATTVSVKTGTALVTRSGSADTPTEVGRRLLAIGTLTVNRTFGRYWSGRLSYDRSVRYIEGFPEPFTSTAFVGRVGGRVGLRLHGSVQVDYSNGKALDTPVAAPQTFRALLTQARLTHDLSRHWQLYAEHHYTENHLSVAAMASLAPGIIPHRFSRGLRVGLNLWAPRVH